jgi:glycosyltransferase involved in cell wall biosynthesis
MPRVDKTFVPDLAVATWLPTLTVTVRQLLTQRPFDCLVTSSPPESAHLVGLLLGRCAPAWIADFRDGWTFEPMRPTFPLAPQRALDSFLEQRVARAADVAIGATRPIAEDLTRRLGAHARFVTNAWDPLLEPAGKPSPLPVDPECFTFVYTGTFQGPRRADPAPFLRALGRLASHPDVGPVRFVHAGRLIPEERALIERCGVSHLVAHIGSVSRSEALSLQRSADALVLLTSRSSSEATGKLFEYMAAGRPIIALADANEAARIVRATNTGVTVPQDDVDAITAALRRAVSGELAGAYAPRRLDEFTYPGPAEQVAEAVEVAIERHALRGQR